MAYGPLSLKPWEFERLTPRELDLMYEGYKHRQKAEDANRAFFSTLLANVHLKTSNRLKAKDIMDVLHPKTAEEREREEAAFMREFMQEREAWENGQDD